VLAAGALLACAGTTSPLQAEPKPLWELGFGAGALAFSDYRGADSSRVYPLPVPYVVYRGRFLQADREGVRGVLFDEPRASLNVSLNATTPVDSDSDGARAGMPDLDAALEIGPSLDLHLWRSEEAGLAVDLRLPVRASFTVATDPRFIGWQLAPKLNLDVRDPFGLRDWNLGVQAGPLFADRRYHDYFYRVDAMFATAQRPTYAASGGFAGTQMLASASKRFERSWFGAFVRYDRLDGATFLASPLVRQRSAFAAGFGFAVIFASSSELVDTGL
jgi:outer membrane scaffolding protein for murein synthesis (MipA/OmpV family)